MLSIFPEILFLAPLSAFIIRLALGVVFAYSAWEHCRKEETSPRALCLIESLVAVALVVGIWTQPAALLGGVIASTWLALPQTRTVAFGSTFLSLVLCLSLLVTGAGAFAFDLPL